MAFERLKKLFIKNKTENIQEIARVTPLKDFLDNDTGTPVYGISYCLQQMAFWAIVRKIGSAVASVKWETYRRGRAVEANESWCWNVEPNPNQTREEFFQALVGQLFRKKEALVVEVGRNARYVADSFACEKHLSGDIYSSVTTHEHQLPGIFKEQDVMHITYEGMSYQEIMASVSDAQGKLIKSASSSYVRNQGMRGILKIDDTTHAAPGFEDEYEELVNDKFKKFFNAENAVLPLFSGYEFDMKESTGGSTKSSLSGTRDIRSLYDDIIELTAQTMGVPLSVVTGKQPMKEDFTQFITSCVMPIVKMFCEEANRKIYGRTLVAAGTYMRANYNGIRYADMFDLAEPIDKLISSGVFSVNDIRQCLGLDRINEEWADQHWITKNYSPAQDLLAGLQESEGKEEEDNE